jgi:hypothetical protein
MVLRDGYNFVALLVFVPRVANPITPFWDCTKIRVKTATASASVVTAWCLGYASSEAIALDAAG